MNKWTFALLSLVSMAACGHGVTVTVDRARPATLQGDPSECLGPGRPALSPCLLQLGAAVEQGDRSRAGQLLLLLAPQAPAGAVRDVARAALWLEPHPFVPDGFEGLPADLTDLSVPEGGVPEGSIVVFGGATGVTSASGAPVHTVDLAIPAGDHPLVGGSLATLVAAAAGGVAAAWQADGAVVSAPAAPLLTRLLGAPPAEAPGTLDWAVLAGRADRALRNGLATEASVMLGEAIEALPKSAPACRTRGALLLARMELSQAAFSGDRSETRTALEEACTKAEVPESEKAEAEYLETLLFVEDNRGSAASRADRPDAWATAKDRDAWSATALEVAGRVGGVRGALLRALVDQVRIGAQEPEGPCDDGFEARQEAAQKEIAGRIDATGRTDLGLSFRTRGLTTDKGTVDRRAVSELVEWANLPENLWMRGQIFSSALGATAYVAMTRPDPGAFAPLCKGLYEELGLGVRRDTFEGFADRHLTRLTSGFTAAIGCANREPLKALVRDVMAAAANGGDGKVGVLAVLVGAGTHLFQAVITGRTAELPIALDTLLDGIAHTRELLGDSLEDQALDAALLGVQGVAGFFMEGGSAPAARLANAAEALARISVEPVTEETPMMVRLAPGLHLASLSLLAIGHAATGDDEAAEATLVTLDQVLDGDMEALLSNLDAPAHAPQLVKLVRAARAVVTAGMKGSPSAFEQARGQVEAAQQPGPGEAGWWAIGLDTGRFLLWDVLAFVANEGGQPGITEAALVQAEGVTDRLVATVLDTFELHGSGWELLSVVPVLHKEAGRLLTGDFDTVEIMRILAKALNDPIREGLSRLSKAVGEVPTGGAGFVDLLIQVLMDVTDVGVEALAQEDGAGRAELGRRLLARGEGYPNELRSYLDMGAGVLLFETDRAVALEALDRAEEEARGSVLARYAYLPDLVRARMLLTTDELREAVASVDSALAYGDEARQCGKFHETQGLLPFKGWALVALGDHEEAQRTLREYETLVDSGFSGEGAIDCRMMSYRDKVIAILNLGHQFGGIMLPVSNDGTFQVSLGFQSNERTHDRLVCSAAPVPTRRPDRIMAAHLAAAIYAFLADDDRTAHAELLEASAEGRMLLNGTPQVLGATTGGGISDARDKLYLPLVAWATVIARARGHAHIAQQIEDIGRAIGGMSEKTLGDALPEDDALPSFLERLPRLAPLAPVVRQWVTAQGPADVGPLGKAFATAARASKVVPAWGTPFAVNVLQVSFGPVSEGGADAAKLKVPKDPVGSAAVGGWKALLALVTGEAQTTEEATRAVTALADAGLYGEASGLAQQVASVAMAAGRRPDAVAILEHAVGLIPKDEAPVARADLLMPLADGWAYDGKVKEAREAMGEVVTALHGRQPAEAEIQQRLAYVNLLGTLRDYEALAPEVSALVAIVGPWLGYVSTPVYRLRAVEVALAVRSGSYDPDQVGAILEWKDGASDVDDANVFLEGLRDAQPDEREALADEYLGKTFGGVPAGQP